MAGEYSIRQTPAPHCRCGNRSLFRPCHSLYTAEICVLFAAIAGVAKRLSTNTATKDGIGLTWPIQWPEVSSFKFSRGYETTFETHRIEADLYHRLALHRRAKGLRHHRRCRARPEQNGRFDNGEKKVYAATAIPYRTYDITLKVNPRSIRIGRSTNSATATCLGCSMCRSSTAS